MNGAEGVMPNNIEHERMRWGSLTERQLWTRLGRITDMRKLRNFVVLAMERGYREDRKSVV